MKKIKYLIITIITFFAFTLSVNAASANLNVSSSSVYVGDSFTVSVNAFAAAWGIRVNHSGPANGCDINVADASENGLNINKTFTATCTATGTGTITLTMSGDITDSSDGNTVFISGNRSVNVSERPAPPVNPPSGGGNGGGGGYTPPAQPQPNNNQDNYNKSSNNNLKSINVKGYSLKKENDTTYSLTVSKNTDSIIVEAVAEDAKTTISHNGENKLNIGNNKIEVVLTAENGATKTIILNITRREKDLITDIESLLKENKKDISVEIKQGDILNSNHLNGLKKSSKNLTLDYIVDKIVLYSWSFKGSSLTNFDDFDTTVSTNRNVPYYIDQITNNTNGLYFKVSNSNNYSNNALLKLFIGDLYKDKTELNVYLFNKNKLDFYATKVDVKNGYIEFPINKGEEFFVTDKEIDTSKVATLGDIGKGEGKSIEIYYYIAIIVIIILLSLVIAKIKSNLSKKKKNDSNVELLDDTII